MNLVVDLRLRNFAPSAVQDSFVLTDLDANGELIVVHGLGGYSDASIWDDNQQEIRPDGLRRIDDNTIAIQLASAVSSFTGTWHYLIER